jgi:hypothetical protein
MVINLLECSLEKGARYQATRLSDPAEANAVPANSRKGTCWMEAEHLSRPFRRVAIHNRYIPLYGNLKWLFSNQKQDPEKEGQIYKCYCK